MLLRLRRPARELQGFGGIKIKLGWSLKQKVIKINIEHDGMGRGGVPTTVQIFRVLSNAVKRKGDVTHS